MVLDEYAQLRVLGKVNEQSRVLGLVQIGAGLEIVNSIIRGPVVIGEQCRITNSFIGPFTAVGSGTDLEDVSIEHSVILERCALPGISRVEDSLIGTGASVVRRESNHQALRLFLGDDAEVTL